MPKLDKYELIIFDWDGTLKDSQSHIVDGLLVAAEKIGRSLNRKDAKNIIGLGINEAIYALFPDISNSDLQLFIKIYREYFYSNLANTRLFEGVEEMLKTLLDRGFRLAVATGMSRAGLEHSMEKLGVAHYFEITRCADETRSKPDPQMLEEILEETGIAIDKAVMVGDTEYDLEMANLAGVDAIGVLCGVHEKERLQSWPTVAVVEQTRDIIEI
ncbi:MAG: HAD family hydrolase [Gammaproteobacteria bacterium]|nr:MAG: HAD family hydrolase [Gammaproteobacteria bacterium]